MSIGVQAAQGYRSVQIGIESARGVEAKVFAEVTAGLTRAARAGKSGFGELASALHRNRLLWDALLADLADPRNALPDTLRAELIGLGHFVRNFSGRVLQGEEDVQPLIDINTCIIAGLRGARDAEGGEDGGS